MITIARTYVQEITPETAALWLSTYCYERQRNLRKYKVDDYAESMINGYWRIGSHLALAINRTRTVIVDGQHRLAAVAKSGISNTFTITEFSCETQEEVDDLYAKHDRGLPRSLSDAMVAKRAGEMLNLTKTWTNVVGAAIQFIHTDFVRSQNRKMPLDEISDKFHDYGESIMRYIECVSEAPRLLSHAVQRSSVVSVGLVTLRFSVLKYGEKPVLNFWRGLASDDGLRRSDPRKIALNHISNTNISSTTGSGNVVGPNYQSRFIANCFNAWTENRELRMTKVFDSLAPISINGTPWNGKARS